MAGRIRFPSRVREELTPRQREVMEFIAALAPCAAPLILFPSWRPI